MQGRNNLGGGGTDPEEFINGVIQEAKAQGVVTAGDFVSLINDFSSLSSITDRRLLGSEDYVGSKISAVALSDNKVLIIYTSSSTSYLLYGMVCTISGTTITKGTSTQLGTANSSGLYVSAVALSSTKVFIAHSTNGSYPLSGMVCTISGTTITKGNDILLASIADAAKNMSTIKLDSTKVFIAFYGDSSHINGMVCTISGTAITAGTNTSICATSADLEENVSAVALSSTKVFIARSYGTNKYLAGAICTVSETTITKDYDFEINNSSNSGVTISVVALSNNKVFIAHSYGTYRSLYGIICTISGTRATHGTDTLLNATNYSAYESSYVKGILIGQNKVFLTYNNGSSTLNNILTGMLCTITDTTITQEGIDLLNDTRTATNSLALLKGAIFIAHANGSNYLYGMILQYSFDTLAKKITSNDEQIGGVAITSGASGQTVSIKKPNV